MELMEERRALAAAVSTATALGMTVNDTVVLHSSNKLSLRLRPCDTVARVAPVGQQVAGFEVELARWLTVAGCPVAALDPRVEPRVYARDGFVVTLWTYYPVRAEREVPPAHYAASLARLHAGMRTIEVAAPHFTERVEQAQRLVANRDRTSALADEDRALLANILENTRRSIGPQSTREQLLHGEPHPGNLLRTGRTPLFIDFETCCHGPVEFDLAHAPAEVSDHYPGVDQALLRDCRILVLAMISAWRWDQDDQLPDGPRLGADWLRRLRVMLAEEG